jgi:hypothetical protein
METPRRNEEQEEDHEAVGSGEGPGNGLPGLLEGVDDADWPIPSDVPSNPELFSQNRPSQVGKAVPLKRECSRIPSTPPRAAETSVPHSIA